MGGTLTGNKVVRLSRSTSRRLHVTSKRPLVESFSRRAPPRPRPRFIPPPAAATAVPKPHGGLSKPADHERFESTQDLLNPREASQKLLEEREAKLAAKLRREEQERKIKLAADLERRAAELKQREQERIQHLELLAAHVKYMRRVHDIDERLDLYPTKEDLEREVKLARIKAKFDKIRARRLRMEEAMLSKIPKPFRKAHHDLKMINSSVRSVQAGLHLWHRNMAEDRKHLVAVANDVEATLSNFRESESQKGRSFSRDAEINFTDLIGMTEMAGVLQINSELVKHGISSSHSQNLFMEHLAPGRTNNAERKVRRVLIDLIFWSLQAQQTFNDISRSLHIYRRLRAHGLLCRTLPEIFANDYSESYIYPTLLNLSSNSMAIKVHLRTLLRTFLRLARSRSFYHAYPSYHLPLQMIFDANIMRKEYAQLREYLLIYPKAGDLPLQQAQIHDFRPFYDMLSNLSQVSNDLALVEVMEHSVNYHTSGELRTPSRVWFYANWKRILNNCYRETHGALTIARLWRGIANMTLGLSKKPATLRRVPLMESRRNHAQDLDLRSAQLKLQRSSVEQGARAPAWLTLPRSLYTQQSQVPIHYLTTMRSAEVVLEQFTSSSVLGIDLLMKPPPKTGPEAMKSRASFLLIASERAIGIFDMDCLNVATDRALEEQIFRSTLGNQAITKVGVHTELQRRVLADDNSIELVNALDLAQERLSSVTGIDQDPTIRTLSTLAEKNFGLSLPFLIMSDTVLYQAGKRDPTAYFGHLASRPYAALQLFNKTQKQGGLESSDDQTALSLGPVVVHPLPRDLERLRFITKRSPSLYAPSSAYISELVEGESILILRHNTYLKDRRNSYGLGKWGFPILGAYVRLTTFSRPFDEVCAGLWPTLRPKIDADKHLRGYTLGFPGQNHRVVCASILLSFAKKARLPLKIEHESELRESFQNPSAIGPSRPGFSWLAWADEILRETLDKGKSTDASVFQAERIVKPIPTSKPIGKATARRRRRQKMATTMGTRRTLETVQMFKRSDATRPVVRQVTSYPVTPTVKPKREIGHTTDSGASISAQQDSVGLVTPLFKPFVTENLASLGTALFKPFITADLSPRSPNLEAMDGRRMEDEALPKQVRKGRKGRVRNAARRSPISKSLDIELSIPGQTHSDRFLSTLFNPIISVRSTQVQNAEEVIENHHIHGPSHKEKSRIVRANSLSDRSTQHAIQKLPLRRVLARKLAISPRRVAAKKSTNVMRRVVVQKLPIKLRRVVT